MQYIITYFLSLHCILGSLCSLSLDVVVWSLELSSLFFGLSLCCLLFIWVWNVVLFAFMLPSLCFSVYLYVAFCLYGFGMLFCLPLCCLLFMWKCCFNYCYVHVGGCSSMRKRQITLSWRDFDGVAFCEFMEPGSDLHQRCGDCKCGLELNLISI